MCPGFAWTCPFDFEDAALVVDLRMPGAFQKESLACAQSPWKSNSPNFNDEASLLKSLKRAIGKTQTKDPQIVLLGYMGWYSEITKNNLMKNGYSNVVNAGSYQLDLERKGCNFCPGYKNSSVRSITPTCKWLS